jgi:hypothetical protein
MEVMPKALTPVPDVAPTDPAKDTRVLAVACMVSATDVKVVGSIFVSLVFELVSFEEFEEFEELVLLYVELFFELFVEFESVLFLVEFELFCVEFD